MLYTITDNCGYCYDTTTLLALYLQMLNIMNRVDFDIARDFEVKLTPNTATEQIAAAFANSKLLTNNLPKIPTETTIGGMFAHIRKEANRQQMGTFQYITMVDCLTNGDQLGALSLLIHKPEFNRGCANETIPLAVTTIEGIEDYVYEHNRKEDLPFVIVPATWTGRTWVVAGIFSESDWMTKAGYVPGPQHDKYAPRWMINDCLRYSVHHPYANSERYDHDPTRQTPRHVLRPRRPAAPGLHLRLRV